MIKNIRKLNENIDSGKSKSNLSPSCVHRRSDFLSRKLDAFFSINLSLYRQ